MRHVLLLLATFVFTLVLATAGLAQVPMLEISAPDGQPQLKNVHTAAATAWFVQFTPIPQEPGMKGETAPLIAFGDLMPFPSQAPIPPGGVFRWKPPVEGRDFKMLATLYEDGSIAGDGRLISRLLDIRQFLYSDAADNLQYLDEFQTRQDKDLQALAREFRLRFDRHNALLQQKLAGPPRITGNVTKDINCAWILERVESALRGEDKFVPLRFKPLLWGRYDALGVSKPPLAPLPAPGGWMDDMAAAAGKTPLLGLSWRQDEESGLIEIRIHNTGLIAATAYVYEFDLPDGTKMWSRVDTASQPVARHLRAGASDFTSMLGRFGNPETKQQFRGVANIKSSGVIYEDGTAAGNAEEIERLLARRRILFNSIPKALAAIREAQEKPDQDAMMARFDACAQANREQLTAAGLPEQEDAVCRPMVVMLRRGNVPSKEALAKGAQALEAIYARLKESKPALAPAANAAETQKPAR